MLFADLLQRLLDLLLGDLDLGRSEAIGTIIAQFDRRVQGDDELERDGA